MQRSSANGDQKGQENDEVRIPKGGRWPRVRRPAGRPWQRQRCGPVVRARREGGQDRDPSTEIKAEAGKIWKEDIKKTKITVEGADVEISKVVLRWKGRKDDTITKVGVVKSGGRTAKKDAPGREATLTSVAIQSRSSMINRRPPSKFGDTTERGVNTGQRTCSRDQRAKGEAIRVHVCWSRARLRRSRFTGTGGEASVDEARRPTMTGFDIESIAVQQCRPSGPKRSTCRPSVANRR